MSASQATQLDALFKVLDYGHVALAGLLVYDYILCIPDSIAYIVESRWRLGTLLYLVCTYFPFCFLLMDMLEIFQPNASSTLCRSYFIAHNFIGLMTMLSAECIFVVRAHVAWGRRFSVFVIINVIAYMVPIILCFQQGDSLVSVECWIPGVVGYLDDMASSRLIVVYCLLVVAEFEILLFLLYRGVKSHRSGFDSRLMRGLVQDNLIYFCCSFVLSLTIILAIIFIPFPVANMVESFQVVLLSVLVTRMHMNFWKSDRASRDIYGQDISLTTFVVLTPDLL